MSTARHSPRPSRVSVYTLVFRSLPSLPLPRRRSLLSLSLPLFLSSFLSFAYLPLSLFLSLFSVFLRPLSLLPIRSFSLFCPVSAHRPRARPPRLSGKSCCEPLTVTKVPTYKRGLIPARVGNSREHGHGNVRQAPRRELRENCEPDPSADSANASPNAPLGLVLRRADFWGRSLKSLSIACVNFVFAYPPCSFRYVRLRF